MLISERLTKVTIFLRLVPNFLCQSILRQSHREWKNWINGPSAVVTCDIIPRPLIPLLCLCLAESKFECEAEQRRVKQLQLQWPATTNCTKRNAFHAAAAAERRVHGEIFSHSAEETDNRRKTTQQFVSDRVNPNANTRCKPGCEQSLLLPQRHSELRNARQRSSQARTHPVRTITSNKHITVSHFVWKGRDTIVWPSFSTPATRRNCVVLTKKLANANTETNANLPTAFTNCVTYSATRSTRPNCVALFTASDSAPTAHGKCPSSFPRNDFSLLNFPFAFKMPLRSFIARSPDP